MALEVGSIVEGTVSGIAKFGAFVELPENKVGLVHISEVANEYVSDVAQYLKVKDTVKVKVISIDAKGKIALSVKQAQPKMEEKKASREELLCMKRRVCPSAVRLPAVIVRRVMRRPLLLKIS